MKRLVLTEIAKSDLASIRRYSMRTWGRDQTSRYIDDLRDTMKGLVRGTVITRARDDLRPGVLMATAAATAPSSRADDTRILVVRVLHDRMVYRRHLDAPDADEGA